MDHVARDRHGSARVNTSVRLVPLAVCFAIGALVSRLALLSVPARFSIDLAQPIPVVTWWGSTGERFVAILLVTIAAAAVPYALSLRREAPPLRDILVASAIALLAALCWLPLFSSDVYAYAAYGEMGRLGIDPYAHGALSNSNELFRAATWQWSGSLPICVYGTLFVAIAKAVVTLTQSLGATLQLDAFRVLAVAAFLVSTVLITQCGAKGDDRRSHRAALFFGLNPIALWVAAEGHNDALMLAAVLAGVALYRRSAALGAFVTILAAAIKIPALLAGAALALQALLERRDWRVVPAALVAFGLVVVTSLPLLAGTMKDLTPHGHYAPFASVQSLHPALAVIVAVAVLFRARGATTVVDRFTLAALAAWLFIPNPYPWYALWLLPLGAWATDRRIAMTVVLVCAAALLRYIPDAVAIPSIAGTLVLGLAALFGYTPLLWRGIIVRS